MPKLLKWALAAGALATAIYFLVAYLQRHWPAVAAHDWRLEPGWLAASWILLVISMALTAEGWRKALALLGGPLPVTRAWWVWALGQTGKYIPGMIWPLAAKVALTRRHGVAPGLVALSGLAELALFVGSALCFGLLALPFVGAPLAAALDLPPSALYGGWLIAGAGLLILHPRIFSPLTSIMLKAGRITEAPRGLTPLAILRLLGWYLLAWAVHSAAMALLCRAAAPDLAADLWATVAAAYVIAFIAGFLVIFLPMGLGVQEAAFALLAGAAFPDEPVAVVLCLATRLWLGLGELSLLALSTLLSSALSSARRRSAP